MGGHGVNGATKRGPRPEGGLDAYPRGEPPVMIFSGDAPITSQ